MSLKQLRAALPGVEIEDDPYDLGYWSRIAGGRRPRDARKAEGWDQADREESQASVGVVEGLAAPPVRRDERSAAPAPRAE
jgi:hypothetical protein